METVIFQGRRSAVKPFFSILFILQKNRIHHIKLLWYNSVKQFHITRLSVYYK